MSQLSSADIEAISLHVAKLMSGGGNIGKKVDGGSGQVVVDGVKIHASGDDLLCTIGDEKVSGDKSVDEAVSGGGRDSGAAESMQQVNGSVVAAGLGSGLSWADEVESLSSQGSSGVDSVQMPERVEISSCVKKVKFGGIADVVGAAVLPSVEEGFFARYVRAPNVLALHASLVKRCGIKLPKAAMEELALSTYTTATVPVAFANGGGRLRSLSAVGDAALTFVMVARMHAEGQAVVSVQNAKSARLSNATMSAVYSRSEFVSHVSFPGGIDVATNKLSADALEALVGVIANYRDVSAVVRFANHISLF